MVFLFYSSSYSSCNACKEDSNSILYEYTKTCICKSGYKLNEKTRNCEPCFLYKG